MGVASFFNDACQDETALTYGGVDYDSVVVNDACWFRNLRTSTFTNGDAIEITGSFDWYLAGSDNEPAYSVVTSDASLTVYEITTMVLPLRTNVSVPQTAWTDGDWQALEVHLGMDPAETAATGSRGTDEGYQLKASGSTCLVGWVKLHRYGYVANRTAFQLRQHQRDWCNCPSMVFRGEQCWRFYADPRVQFGLLSNY